MEATDSIRPRRHLRDLSVRLRKVRKLRSIARTPTRKRPVTRSLTPPLHASDSDDDDCRGRERVRDFSHPRLNRSNSSDRYQSSNRRRTSQEFECERSVKKKKKPRYSTLQLELDKFRAKEKSMGVNSSPLCYIQTIDKRKRYSSFKNERLSFDRQEMLIVLDEINDPPGYICKRGETIGCVLEKHVHKVITRQEDIDLFLASKQRIATSIAPKYQIDSLDVIMKNKERIGEGGFGIIYKAKWMKDRGPIDRISLFFGVDKSETVAIKKFRGDNFTEENEKEFLNEAAIMSMLDSPYIIKFFGFFTFRKRFWITMEYLENKSLYTFLHSERVLKPVWSQLKQVNMALDIARGLDYLHRIKILHRDIKSHNILLDEDLNPKLCDLGFAKIKEHSRSTTNSKQPTCYWTALEVFKQDIYTEASEIYSYGLVLFEILTSKVPFEKHLTEYALVKALKREKRLKIPDTALPEFKDMINRCSRKEPKDRPALNEVINVFSQLTTKLEKTEALPEKEVMLLDGPSDTDALSLEAFKALRL